MSESKPSSMLDEIMELFALRGSQAYLGEPVSQLEHALQTAALACQANAAEAEIVAALLHDVGHLLHDQGDQAAEQGIDAGHESVGRRWLAFRMPEEVCQLIHLHVAAKRYLCATEATYLHSLSPASQRSLQLQGGPMTPEECQRFETSAGWQSAVRLRRWDDLAKVPGLQVAELATYRPLLQRWLRD